MDDIEIAMVRWAEKIEKGALELQKEVADAIQQTLIEVTPVKTGRAKNNWKVGLGNPDESVDLVGPFDQSGHTQIQANHQIIESHDTPVPIYISNNLDYIDDLNSGTSRQAPAGFVEAAVVSGQNAVKTGRLFK